MAVKRSYESCRQRSPLRGRSDELSPAGGLTSHGCKFTGLHCLRKRLECTFAGDVPAADCATAFPHCMSCMRPPGLRCLNGLVTRSVENSSQSYLRDYH